MKYLLFLFPIFLQAQCLIETHSYRLVCADEVRYADSTSIGSRLYISSRNAFVTSPRSVFSLVNGYGQHFIQITNAANSQKVAINRAWINRIDSTSSNKALIYIKDISVTFTSTESYTAVKDSAIACFVRAVSSGLATLSDGDYGDVIVSGGGLVMTVDKPDLGLHNLADGDFSVVADSTALSLTNSRRIELTTKNIDGWISRYLQNNISLTLRTASSTKTSRIHVDTTGANFQFVNGANSASLRIGDSVAVRFNTSGSVGQVLTVTSIDGDGRLVINPKTGGSGTANCEQTLTKTSHGFRKWTPIYWNGSAWARPAYDSIIPTYIVVDSTTANTFKVSNCGNYSSTLTAGLYYYTGTSPGYTLTQPAIKTPLFEVAQSRLILQPLVGFQLASGATEGISSSVLADTAAAIRNDFPSSVNIYNSDGVIPSGTTRTVNLGTGGAYLQYKATTDAKKTEYYIPTTDGLSDNYGYNSQTKTGGYYFSNSFASNGIYIKSRPYTFIDSKARQNVGIALSSIKMQASIFNTTTSVNKSTLILSADSVNTNTSALLNLKTENSTTYRSHWAGLSDGLYGDGQVERAIATSPSFIVQTSFYNSSTKFDWIRVKNLDTDTTSNSVELYNGKYPFANASPGSGIKGHFWNNGTPFFSTLNNAITGTARVIPYINNGGRLYAGNDYFKIDTNTTSGGQARVRILINNPNGDLGEGDSYSSLSVRTGDGTTTESIINFGDQALTNGTVGYNSVIQGFRANGTFAAKTNLTNGQTVHQFAARGQANGGSRALGHFGFDYTGDGTTINSSIYGASAVSGSVVRGFLLDNQSRFWLGSGADDYYMATTAPVLGAGAVSTQIQTGTGSAATPSWQRSQHGVATGTTDGSGDLTVTFAAAMPDITYTGLVTSTTTGTVAGTVHTKATGTMKVRFYNPLSGGACTGCAVSLDYEVKDY